MVTTMVESKEIEMNIYPPKEMPKVSVGTCINVRNCKASATDLADGWCVNCWDKGDLAKAQIKITAERREEEKKSKLLLKRVRQRVKDTKRTSGNKSHRKNCACEYHKNKGFNSDEYLNLV